MKILAPLYSKRYEYGSKLNFFDTIPGVPYYRLYLPLKQMAEDYKDVEVVFTDGMENVSDKDLKGVDIVLVSYSYIGSSFFKRVKDKGIKIILDVDDNLRREVFHSNFIDSTKNKYAERIETLLKFCDGIIVTGAQLKKKLQNLNKNILIAGNFVDDTLPAYNTKLTKNKKIKCGYAGGAEHDEDIKLLLAAAKNNEIILTLSYFEKFGYNFKYFQPLHITQFPEVYDLWDITLIPVIRSEFTYYKSPLKLVESGFKHKPVICSYEYPYKPYLKHKKNCLIARTPYDFDRWIYWLKQNPEEIERLGEALYETVKKEFDKHEITERRYKFLKGYVA